uniref:Uncharacterized protein n=1 Tax=Noctiluca scintillans TaxID=2966 RepID=A0A7S1B1B1_NOCSC
MGAVCFKDATGGDVPKVVEDVSMPHVGVMRHEDTSGELEPLARRHTLDQVEMLSSPATKASLDEPFMEIAFLTGETDSLIVPIKFYRKPLGLEFHQRVPIVITGFKLNSYAETLGVQKGWTVTRIGAMEVSSMTYKDIFSLLVESVQPLADAV